MDQSGPVVWTVLGHTEWSDGPKWTIMAKQDVPKVVKLDDPSKWAILRVETGQSFRMKMDGPLI